jgi:hypothetical protein
MIRPAVSYGGPIWAASLSATQIKRLQTSQNKILRSITRARWFHTNAVLHSELGIQRFNEFLIESAKNFKKSLEKHPNPLIRDLWSLELEGTPNLPQNILISTENFPSKRRKVKIHHSIVHLDPPLPLDQNQTPALPIPRPRSSSPRFLQPPEPD